MNHWADYVIFCGFILVSLGIGLYHALTGGKQRTTEEFIMADRQLKLLPTGLSLLMSYQSAITVIGVPAETYTYGIQQWPMWIGGFWIAIIIAERFFVPWLYPLKLTSVNRYFEMRYGDREIRAFASMIGILSAIMYMGVAMFAPAVALETATGFPTMISMPIMSVVCILYTAMGGMRAVIWTDVFQFVVMTAGMLAVLIKGMISVGGAANAFDELVEQSRDNWIEIDPNPLGRQSLWGFMFGWSLQWACVFGLQQAAVQRYSAVPTLRNARLSILFNIPGLFVINSLANLIGIAVLAHYAYTRCDPMLSDRISVPNQILPLFVREMFVNSKGFAGLFLATLFSGALSSVSSSLSGAAANAWDDILHNFLSPISEYRATVFNKLLVIVLGLSATGFSFMTAMMTGPIAQLAVAFFGACGGPLLGMFLLSGIKAFRWVRSRGVLVGGVFGLVFNMWLSVAAGFLKGAYETKPPLPIDECQPPLNYTIPEPQPIQLEGLDNFYAISYLWYTPLGCFITMTIGLALSAIMNGKEKTKYTMVLPDNIFIPFHKVFECSWGKDYAGVSSCADTTSVKDIPMKDLQEYTVDC